MRLSEEITFKTRANPQVCDQNINRANVYESKLAQTYRDSNCAGASPTLTTHTHLIKGLAVHPFN